ncbi:MAG: ATP-binding cassette domain-containing protein, partial [Deltaproteobacteria bacterium]|nr:ATP-binding cassette domain-containing protein [Deltaproteobacteria bacterium]
PTSSPLPIRPLIRFLGPETLETFARHAPFLSVLKVILGGPGDAIHPPLETTPEKTREASMTSSLFGIQDLLHRPWSSLSTGQAWKVLLARTWLARPRVLVWDEFASSLDPETRSNLAETLDRMAEAMTLRLVLSTHRPDELPTCVNRILELPEGVIRSRPAQSLSVKSAPIRRPGPSVPDCPCLIRMEHCRVRRAGRIILDVENWEIRQGQHWAILGPNGAGKSTLLALAAGRVRPLAPGRVVWFGDPDLRDVQSVRARMGEFSPSLQTLIPPSAQVPDVIASGLSGGFPPIRANDQGCERAKDLAREHGLDDLLTRPFAQLSFGQQRLVGLVRALANEPDLVLLDEPFSGLDETWRQRIGHILAQATSRPRTLVVVTHHPESLPTLTWNVLRLDNGRPD